MDSDADTVIALLCLVMHFSAVCRAGCTLSSGEYVCRVLELSSQQEAGGVGAVDLAVEPFMCKVRVSLVGGA